MCRGRYGNGISAFGKAAIGDTVEESAIAEIVVTARDGSVIGDQLADVDSDGERERDAVVAGDEEAEGV